MMKRFWPDWIGKRTTRRKIDLLNNPYKAGQVLRSGDPLFVGRRDLIEHLERALSKSEHHPTFLLNGERRMGKSSTLKQLPLLLGSRYIPIYYDLQSPGMSSSIAVFLGTIADEIDKNRPNGFIGLIPYQTPPQPSHSSPSPQYTADQVPPALSSCPAGASPYQKLSATGHSPV